MACLPAPSVPGRHSLEPQNILEGQGNLGPGAVPATTAGPGDQEPSPVLLRTSGEPKEAKLSVWAHSTELNKKWSKHTPFPSVLHLDVKLPRLILVFFSEMVHMNLPFLPFCWRFVFLFVANSTHTTQT